MASGSKPGERRGGRQLGTPNKLTAELKRTVAEIAEEYTEAAIQTLVDIMQSIKAPAAARVSAANTLLERAHGKPRQTVEHDVGGTLEQLILGSMTAGGRAEFARLSADPDAALSEPGVFR